MILYQMKERFSYLTDTKELETKGNLYEINNKEET